MASRAGRVLLVVGGVALALFAALAGLWWFLTPADEVHVVPFSTLESDIAAGRVMTIEIDGTRYDYRVRATPSRHLRAEGPPATLETVTALRPSNPDVRPPRIRFGDGGDVPFSELVFELAAGRVSAVHVHRQRWRFELRAPAGERRRQRETVGPKASRDEAAAFVKAHAPADAPPSFDAD